MEQQQDQHQAQVSIIRYLREHTAQIHQQIESTSFMAKFLDKDLNLEKYKQLLLLLYQALAPIEEGILRSAHLDAFSSIKNRIHFKSFQKDLDYFDISNQTTKVSNFLKFDFSTKAKLAGVLYVIEGSSLGGRLLAKSLQKQLHLTHATGLAYFSSQHDLGPQQWALFKKDIEKAIEPSCFNECLQAALDIFRRFS